MSARLHKYVFLLGLALTLTACGQDSKQTAASTPAPAADASAELTWPRKHELNGNTILIYQPQIDSWDGNVMKARAAVALTPAGKTDPEFGIIWISARTDVDKTSRLVTLDNINIDKVSFPEDKANEPNYLALINEAVPDTATDIPLDHIEANLAITDADKKAVSVPVENNVPDILFETAPSILILIDGDPVLKQVSDTRAMRVINTRQLILLDQDSNQYYMNLMNQWVVGVSPRGPWSPAPQVPSGFDSVKDSLAKAGTVDLLIPQNPDGAPIGLPAIFVRTHPAELLQSRGEPEYTPISGTELLYMKNSENAIFMTLGGQYYVLVSGRWFNAPALTGPWAFVPGTELPPDFAKIPPDNAKANVLVSVPGTPEAKEAVIANSIPQTATVNIADAKLTVSYDGSPKFVDIADTQGLQYCTNTAQPVVYVESSQTYYCVNNGVWFYAPSPVGTWTVATVVPPVIYTIPVSSPVHYITYVRIYGSTSTVVYVGYTPGYMGTCVAPDGVVVYGTGYVYPAYVGTVWVGYPPTYGYGAGFACGVATGFAFGFAAGAIIGDCWSHPYWGPCYGFGSVDINTHSVYANWHGGVASVNRHYSYNAWTGESTRTVGGASFNTYTGRSTVGGYSNYVNRSTGDFDAVAGSHSYNARTGIATGHSAQVAGNAYNGTAIAGRSGYAYNTNTGNGVAYRNGDVYAGHDGNVYRHTDDGWQEHSNGGWQSTDRPTERQNLDSQRSSRDLGNQRFQNSRNFGGFHSRGGGGFRGRR
jgi:hypothetical protein